MLSRAISDDVSTSSGGELKLVYRTLRLISDWALVGFYSDVCVRGKENVNLNGPLILCPCHHNEILDIATLSATAPHRRIIGYWAKASLFRNPISRFILESAGSIPVARASQGSTKLKPQQELFAATHAVLASGGALGVFPEGTSYTLPRIVQVKEGAARAALEFVKYAKENGIETVKDAVQVVPVGIVPTDKAQYRSRIYVEYGEPLSLCQYAKQLPDEDGTRSAVQRLTQEIKDKLVKLTINAPDWNTLYASRMARDILWEHEKNVPLDKFVVVSQSLIELFEEDMNDIALPTMMSRLLRYHALLHHTGLSHVHIPSSTSYVGALLKVVPLSIPLVLSVPAHLSHLPGYIFGTFAMRKLGGNEEEARAQYGAIIGGVGVGIGTAISGWLGLKLMKRAIESGMIGKWVRGLGVKELLQKNVNSAILENGKKIVSALTRFWHNLGRMGDILCVLGLAWILCRWHNKIIDANYERFKRIEATFTVFAGLFSSRVALNGWTNPLLVPYLSTPLPPANPFVPASALFSRPLPDGEAENNSKSKVKLPTRKLIGPLLQARKEASEALGSYLRSLEAKHDDAAVKNKRQGEDEGYESVDEDTMRERKEKSKSKRNILAQLKRYGARIDHLP